MKYLESYWDKFNQDYLDIRQDIIDMMIDVNENEYRSDVGVYDLSQESGYEDKNTHMVIVVMRTNKSLNSPNDSLVKDTFDRICEHLEVKGIEIKEKKYKYSRSNDFWVTSRNRSTEFPEIWGKVELDILAHQIRD